MHCLRNLASTSSKKSLLILADAVLFFQSMSEQLKSPICCLWLICQIITDMFKVDLEENNRLVKVDLEDNNRCLRLIWKIIADLFKIDLEDNYRFV